MRWILKNDGVKGFWQGNGANVVRIIPNKAVVFLCNDIYRDMLTIDGEPLSFQRKILAGSMSGVTTTVISYPLDLISKLKRLFLEESSQTQGQS